MGKSRKTVIVDDDVWWGLKERALKAHMGLNEYLDFVLRRSGDPLRADLEDGLVGLERRVDGLRKGAFVEGWRDPRDTVIDGDGKTQNERKGTENPIQKRFREIREDVQEHVKSSNAKMELPDDEVLIKAQEKLEAVRAERKVETAKGPVKANAAMEGFFSPQPKAKWKEK